MRGLNRCEALQCPSPSMTSTCTGSLPTRRSSVGSGDAVGRHVCSPHRRSRRSLKLRASVNNFGPCLGAECERPRGRSKWRMREYGQSSCSCRVRFHSGHADIDITRLMRRFGDFRQLAPTQHRSRPELTFQFLRDSSGYETSTRSASSSRGAVSPILRDLVESGSSRRGAAWVVSEGPRWNLAPGGEDGVVWSLAAACGASTS